MDKYTYRHGRDNMKERNTMNHLSSSSPPPSGDDLNEIIAQMMLAPLVMMCMQLEAIMLREFEIARGIYTNHAEKFEGTARNIMDKFFERF